MRRELNDVAQQKLKDHLNELRARLAWVVFAVVVFSVAAYTKAAFLTDVLQAPIHQKLYYTTPGGGFSFVLKLSVLTGIMVSLPIIVYHIFAFIAPIIENRKRGFVLMHAVWSFILAYCGVVFAYYVTLPAALHFLVQFGGNNIQALIGANDYFNFVLAYLVGFAVLFQIPLVVLFIDKITPLPPRRMMSYQRYVILFSFIVAAMITPTPDPLNQLLMALPIIGLYQVSIVLIWQKHRSKKHKQAARGERRAPSSVQPVIAAVAEPQEPTIIHRPVSMPPRRVVAASHRPRQYMDFVPRSRPGFDRSRPSFE